jgi:hypothetical protein
LDKKRDEEKHCGGEPFDPRASKRRTSPDLDAARRHVPADCQDHFGPLPEATGAQIIDPDDWYKMGLLYPKDRMTTGDLAHDLSYQAERTHAQNEWRDAMRRMK